MSVGKAERERELEEMTRKLIEVANAADSKVVVKAIDDLVAPIRLMESSGPRRTTFNRRSAREYNAGYHLARTVARWAAQWPKLSVVKRRRRVGRLNDELHREKVVAPVIYRLVEPVGDDLAPPKDAAGRWRLQVDIDDLYCLSGIFYTVVFAGAQLIERVSRKKPPVIVGRCAKCARYLWEKQRRGPRRKLCEVCAHERHLDQMKAANR